MLGQMNGLATGLTLAALALMPALAPAQSKTVLGSTNANSCYHESNHPSSQYGLKYCTRAIEQDQLGRRDLAATYNNRGIIYAANGKLQEAMADHNQAAEIAPRMGKVFLNRGNVHHRFKDYTQALSDYDRAMTLGKVPLDVLHYNRALTLIQMKRMDAARASLRKALQANIGLESARNILARLESLPQNPAP